MSEPNEQTKRVIWEVQILSIIRGYDLGGSQSKTAPDSTHASYATGLSTVQAYSDYNQWVV